MITRRWTYANRSMEMPTGEIRVTLTAPSGADWTWGPDGADSAVSGSAEDFCLVVTQRRNLADVDLSISGSAALEWMQMAQAFAGPPTDAPSPRASS
ncbi:MAG: hypothetical protein R2695_10280 [Acidimicrobiales bacterium]